MSEYLKNLQESVILTESFHRTRDIPISLSEEEIREELQGIFESDEDLETFMQEADWNLIGKYAGGTVGKIQSAAEKAGMQKGAAATAIVAAAALAAVGIYKRFLSKAAKDCAGLPTTEKTNCIRKHKIDAIKAKISSFEASKSKCSYAKNPEGCNNKMMYKIKAERAKLGD